MRTAALRSILRCSATALFLMPVGAAVAGPENPAAANPSPFLGTWELDLARMPANYGSPPRRVVYTFEDVGAGQWRTSIDITAPDGSVRHMAVRYARDGSASAGEGDKAEADNTAINQPASNVLVMSLAKNKMLGSVRVYAVSANGKEMKESAAAADAGGAPFFGNFHFRRLRRGLPVLAVLDPADRGLASPPRLVILKVGGVERTGGQAVLRWVRGAGDTAP